MAPNLRPPSCEVDALTTRPPQLVISETYSFTHFVHRLSLSYIECVNRGLTLQLNNNYYIWDITGLGGPWASSYIGCKKLRGILGHPTQCINTWNTKQDPWIMCPCDKEWALIMTSYIKLSIYPFSGTCIISYACNGSGIMPLMPDNSDIESLCSTTQCHDHYRLHYISQRLYNLYSQHNQTRRR